MRMKDRHEAAVRLAGRLSAYRGSRPLVLGVPRGAVPMAREIAEALGGDVDVVLVRKLRAPGHPEFAVGAIDEHGHVLRSPFAAGLSETYLREEIAEQLALLQERRTRYTRARTPIDVRGRIVIIVDDGIATGASMLAAIRSVRARQPATIVVATPVAAPSSLEPIRAEADEVVCLQAPADFAAVGQYYDDFSEVTDEMVVAAL